MRGNRNNQPAPGQMLLPNIPVTVHTIHGEPGQVWAMDQGLADAGRWRLTTKGGHWQASTAQPCLFLHRLILERKIGRPLEPGEQCDHIDRDPSNNCRDNLRLANRQQNARNHGIRKNNTSGVIGVSLDKSRQKWRAFIYVDRREIHLGDFTDFDEAVRVRRAAEIEYFGEFAPQ